MSTAKSKKSASLLLQIILKIKGEELKFHVKVFHLNQTILYRQQDSIPDLRATSLT